MLQRLSTGLQKSNLTWRLTRASEPPLQCAHCSSFPFWSSSCCLKHECRAWLPLITADPSLQV